MTERRRERERQRDRETERHRYRDTERQRDRETERQRYRETERQRYIETEREGKEGDCFPYRSKKTRLYYTKTHILIGLTISLTSA